MVKKILSVIVKTAGVLLALVVIFLITLFFRGQRLPQFLVSRICEAISSRQFAVRCDSIAVGFRHGLRLAGAKVYDLEHFDSLENPVVSIRSASLNYFTRTVRISGVAYHRLPDAYYEPLDGETYERERLDLVLPDLPEFRLIVEDSNILGIAPERAAATVLCRPDKVSLSDIGIELSDREGRSSLSGSFTFDIAGQKARGELTGSVMHGQIHPFLDIMDIPSSLPYVDAFTEVTAPIPARIVVEVDLTSRDVDVIVDVSPRMGRYMGVPLAKAEGTVDVKYRHVDTNGVCRVKVDLPVIMDNDGRAVTGFVAVDNVDGPYRVRFHARGGLMFKDSLKMLDLIDPSAFDFLVCHSPPELNVSGSACTSPDDLDANDISGKVFLKRGALSGFAVNDLSADCKFRRDILDVDMHATGKTGGRVDATAAVDFGGFKDVAPKFRIKSAYRNGSLEEIGDLFTFDLGERNGKVDWDIELSGLAGEESGKSLNGQGSVVIKEGHLAQMKLFAGLTALLAEKIPGVSFLVTQTQASTNFVIKDGIFISDDVYIEGGLLSIKGWGKYDIAADNLDFVVRVQFLKKESLAGKIVHPVTLPFTKLLLEFKVDGPIDNPTWKYIKILDRIF